MTSRPSWMSIKSVKDKNDMREKDCRDPFLKAYGVVIHSSQFRRLSHKTQVYLNTHSDYARTRLTHSIEVSQIGIQLARVFNESIFKKQNRDFKIKFEYLTATTCLAHDIGHPPFGHSGEERLKELAGDVGFNANKQNVRLLLGSPPFREAFSVPYCLVDAVMK